MCGNSFKVESTKKPDYTKDNPKQLKVHTNSRFLALRRLEGRHHSAALTGGSIKRSEGREAKPSVPERKAGEGIRTELFEVRISVAVRRTAALTSRSEGRESATSEGREAKPSGPERKAGEGIRTLDIRHGRPVRTRQSFENALCSDPNAVQHTITVPFVPLNS